MKLFAFALFLTQVWGKEGGLLRSSDVVQEKMEQRSRSLQFWDFTALFNPCGFFVNLFLNGENLNCGCGFNLLLQKFDLQCSSKFCTGLGDAIDEICVNPNVDMDWNFGGTVETGICTPPVESVNMKLAGEGGKVEDVNFDMPPFCMNLTAVAGIIPTVTACKANLGGHVCGCSLCESGVDIDIDCSGSTDLPEAVQKVADFGCVGVSSIFAAYDTSSEPAQVVYNPLFLVDGAEYSQGGHS